MFLLKISPSPLCLHLYIYMNTCACEFMEMPDDDSVDEMWNNSSTPHGMFFMSVWKKSVSSSGFPQLSSHTQRVHHHQGRIINKLLNAPMKYLSTRMDPILKKMYTHSTVASIKLFFISFNNKFTMRAKHMRWQLMALFDSTLYSSRKAPRSHLTCH